MEPLLWEIGKIYYEERLEEAAKERLCRTLVPARPGWPERVLEHLSDRLMGIGQRRNSSPRQAQPEQEGWDAYDPAGPVIRVDKC